MLNMSGRSSGGGVKRKREQQVEEEDRPESMSVAAVGPLAREDPLVTLTLLAVVKSHFDTLVSLQLCNPHGIAQFPFVRLAPRVSCPFAGAQVYDMSLLHAERLRAVGCGFKCKLVRLLSLGVGHHFEPQRNIRACHKMMLSIVRRVAAGLAAAVRDKPAKEAAELCASGQCAAAVVPLQRAIYLGDLPSRALMAWLLLDGRKGVAKDDNRGFELVEEGARLGCHHCQGVIAYCYCWGRGCEKDAVRSLELAREGSGRGSRYGQLTLGWLHLMGEGGLAADSAQGLALHRLAAAQGLDMAQCSMGCMCFGGGGGVSRDVAESLRWYQLAAAQGNPHALYYVAAYHQHGIGVAADVAAAIFWYRRAHAAGSSLAASILRSLGA
jgi:TPR repeat protein